MERLVSTQVLGNIDERAMTEFAIPSLLLMEHAGIKGFHRLAELSGKVMLPDSSLVVVAGSGNNGGDALVMAREAYLMGKRTITVLLLGSHISQSSQVHREIIQRLGIKVHEVSLTEGALDTKTLSILEHAGVIIDGILGTGLHSKVNEATSLVIHTVNEQKERGALIVSVDVPSGYSDQLPATMAHVQADITITFGMRKFGSYTPAGRSFWGDIEVVNPSFPPSLMEKAEARAYLSRFSDAKLPGFTEAEFKNRRGHTALFGGSEKYTGAVQLSAYAAFASGSGLVSLFIDEEVARGIRKDHPSFIINTAAAHTPFRNSVLQEYDVIACGPGWGAGRESQLQEILGGNVPVVIDADGISSFGSLLSQKRIETGNLPPVVLTPHPGELRSLLEQLTMPLYAQDTGSGGTPEAFLDALISVARSLNVILVLKSHVTWIADGRNRDSVPIVVEGNNNALGVAGSGDVLTGIIASLIAGGLSAAQAAVGGVLLHQKAGELARVEHRWFDSNRLIEYIPSAYSLIEKGTAK